MKQREAILAVLTSLSLITGCQTINQNNVSTSGINNTSNSIEARTIIKGKVEFPSSAFSSKATLANVSPQATVSLIYPPDNVTNPNLTIATGLTDANGSFIINLSTLFNPSVNSVYVLEASKRIGGNGNALMALRTYIKWNGFTWDSMTSPNIYINNKTTALAIIQSINSGTMSSSSTIGTITISDNKSIPHDVSGVSANTILDVANKVITVLKNDRDPFQYIKFQSGQYSIINPSPLFSKITTVVGGYSGDNDQATNAVINVNKIASDLMGNIFLADFNEHRVKKINVSTGIITTVAGNGMYGSDTSAITENAKATDTQLSSLNAIAIGNYNNLYIAANNRILKVNTLGNVSVIAGTGLHGFDGDNVKATSTKLNDPSSLVLDSNENVYFVDSTNYRIRKIDSSTGIISTVIGSGNFSTVGGLAIDKTGNLYFSDESNNRIKKVNLTTGIISTVAGAGYGSFYGDGGQATSATLYYPRGIAFDSTGNLYVSDLQNHRIRKINMSTGIISTIAGNGNYSYNGDGGQSTSASLYRPTDITVDSSGNLFIAHSDHIIRKVSASTGIISTYAGSFNYFIGEGTKATNAHLSKPKALAFDSSGNIYIADDENNRIRKVDISTGIITTVAGTGIANYNGDGIPATAAQLNAPEGIAIDSSDNLYISDSSNRRIRKVSTSTGIISTVAGADYSASNTGDGGQATSAYLGFTSAITLDNSGNIYFNCNYGTKKVITSTGIITTVTLNPPDPLYYNLNGKVLDNAGNIYSFDNIYHRILKTDVTTGTTSILAGTGISGFSGDEDAATSANLSSPLGIAIDSFGNLYFCDSRNNRIRKIESAIGF